MQREIKFRIWNPKYPSYGLKYIDLRNGSFLGLDELEFQQFTGLKDKNGKDIYEGDILKISELDKSQNPGPGKRSILQTFEKTVVVWKNGSYYYLIIRENCPAIIHQLLFHGYEPEILGNIFENPELLSPADSKPSI